MLPQDWATYWANDCSASTALKPEPEDTTPAGNDISDSPASHIEIRIIHQYLPGVSEIIGWGGGSYIGLVDDTTVLKYPHVPGDRQSLEVEAQLLDILGTHPRIIQSKGLAEHGLLLGYAPNGNLMDYITSDHVIPLERRLNWCQQPAEALSYIHSKRVIHCDLNVRNLLLDENLDLILADFQGMLKSSDGETLLDGLSRECTKSFRPRVHGDYADVHTDLFALGSAIYFIMTGHEPFPELDSFDDEEKIESLYEEGVFPSDEQEHICYYITEKCWKQQYQSARDVVRDITQLQRISEKEDVGI
ncbi:Tyrosine-protein kinase, catalytic domain [Penicillium roqueforti FM164]|uniref:Tyrosine-protein kinase, catalytic domain n=1 Tax=Penicillium roqueforti (strain FM164) TaxID=1365484 RepID=W6Q189_PENRF|nr:Tyrosine-protein kinase, catalytic domain [Penicillium roqueforti FM164]